MQGLERRRAVIVLSFCAVHAAGLLISAVNRPQLQLTQFSQGALMSNAAVFLGGDDVQAALIRLMP